MRKIALLLLLLGTFATSLRAQQKTVHHLLVTIFENHTIGGSHVLIETREDGKQVKKEIDLRAPTSTNTVMQHEDSLLLALKSYFDQGWEITASTAIVESGTTYTTRFFMRKEE